MTNQNNELDELDEIVRRIHFSQASFNELTKEELYEDIGDDCLRVINKGKKAIQALYAPLKKQQNVNTSTEHVKPVNMSLRQAIQDLEFYTKDGEAIDFIHPEHLEHPEHPEHLSHGEQVNSRFLG